MTVTVGRVSWNGNQNSGGLSQNDFFRFKQDGQFRIKLLAEEAFQFLQHVATRADGSITILRCAGPNCTLCADAQAMMKSPDKAVQEEGKKARAKKVYAIEAYILDQDRPAILEFGPQVYSGIRSIRDSLEPGQKLTDIGIKVTRDRSKGPSGMYFPMPLGVKQLTADQQAKADAFLARELDLNKIYAPPSDEANMQRLQRSNSTGGDSSANVATAGAPGAAGNDPNWNDW